MVLLKSLAFFKQKVWESLPFSNRKWGSEQRLGREDFNFSILRWVYFQFRNWLSSVKRVDVDNQTESVWIFKLLVTVCPEMTGAVDRMRKNPITIQLVTRSLQQLSTFLSFNLVMSGGVNLSWCHVVIVMQALNIDQEYHILTTTKNGHRSIMQEAIPCFGH